MFTKSGFASYKIDSRTWSGYFEEKLIFAQSKRH